VQGDPSWLERLILNLVDNAIKFTPTAGIITVRVSQDGERAHLAVHDTGIGITPELRPHIFERFFRADPARSSVVDGVGLGLSLAKWIVDRHHGRIAVDSQPGRGSTFTVFLPLAVH
jgi:signal transduction histidine kinase